MFLKEKFTIRLNRLIRSLAFHFIFWEVLLNIYLFLSPENHIFLHQSLNDRIGSVQFVIVLIALDLSLLFSLVESIFTYRFQRFFPIKLSLFFRSFLYIATAFGIVFFINNTYFVVQEIVDFNSLVDSLPTLKPVEIRFLIFFYVACYLNSFFKESIKKIGRGNFRHWFFGVMNKPAEEERIFMFMDLKGSTTIAEKLGHKKFSHLVQDLFNDLAIVDNYGGEIYQYLGDGAIVSWSIQNGLKNESFAKAYHAVTKLLVSRKRYYNRRYGLEPKFKAGAHVGKVMVLQVGQIRRDISYNGDLLNTAARIESKCNELRQGFLISKELYQMIQSSKYFRFKSMGEIQLRGKRKAVEVFGVNPKAKKK